MSYFQKNFLAYQYQNTTKLLEVNVKKYLFTYLLHGAESFLRS